MYNRKMSNADRRIAALMVRADVSCVRRWRDGMKKFPNSAEFRKEYDRALVDFGKACNRQRSFVDSVTKELFR